MSAAFPMPGSVAGDYAAVAGGLVPAGAASWRAERPEPRRPGRGGANLVFQDAAMEAVVQRAEKIAKSDASVLIYGESGTGKEVLAQYIHHCSRRSSGPFIAVNCAAIPENLLESELFGHERGAFSGAVAQRIGRFEAAQNGTLLLDEISEMDKRLQAKLLRAIQEREIDRVGGRSPVKINVRIISTTNRDLEPEVSRNTFREDLYFRLNVFCLRIPSLRDRPRDILPLARYFVKKFSLENGEPIRALSAEAIGALQSHDWRGNVRELENTIHRALVLTTGDTVTDAALEVGPRARSPVVAALAPMADGRLKGRQLMQIEREVIIQTLDQADGNRTRTADILGISIRALRNKLRAYAAAGIEVRAPACFSQR
jgi:two-component system response regulator FlrC